MSKLTQEQIEQIRADIARQAASLNRSLAAAVAAGVTIKLPEGGVSLAAATEEA